MESIPMNINLKDVQNDLKKIPFVLSIHDLHIWSITSNFPVLTAHIVVNKESAGQDVLIKANEILKNKYKIEHSTIQIETIYKDNCGQANGCCT